MEEENNRCDVASETEGTAEQPQTPPVRKGFLGKVDNFFGISRAKSTFRNEIIGGLVTFMAMVYILMVNAGMFSGNVPLLNEILNETVDGVNTTISSVTQWNLGVSYGAIYIATALSAIVGTLLMAFVARMPMGQASGMGLNAFFVYTICLGFGLTYANALVLVLIDGVVFILLTVTGLRKKLFSAIPKVVRTAIPAGIGLFIAFIGMQNVGLVIGDSATLVNLASFNFLADATYGSVMPLILTVIGIIAVAVMSKKGMKGALLYGMLGTAALYWAFTGIGYAFDPACKEVINNFTMSNPFTAFKDWGLQSVGQVFANGFNFGAYVEANGAGNLVLVIITSSLAFCMVDMFDTIGTLYGACARGNMLNEDGSIPNINKCMICDAVATTAGAICGTSTVTTFVESSAGIGAGARTGFAALITAGCFFVAMFLSPIAELIPSCATAVALIYGGVLMMNSVHDIEWTDAAEAVPAFLTIAIMPFTYNISYGIAFGIISWLLIKSILLLLNIRKKKPAEGEMVTVNPEEEKINVFTIVIAVLFILMFFLTH